MKIFQQIRAIAVTTLSAVLFFGFSAAAYADTTYTVTDTSDTVSTSGLNCEADGSGLSGEGNCTLRTALYAASLDGDTSIVRLSEGEYVIDAQDDGSGTMPDGAYKNINIAGTEKVEIIGVGSDNVVITSDSSVSQDGIFEIDSATVEISGVTIRNEAPVIGVSGAAISVIGSNASVTLSDCVLQNNEVLGVSTGGAINITGSSQNMTIERCVLKENSAQNTGGAIYSDASSSTITIEDTEFDTNSAGTGSGGAIALNGTSDLSIHRSLFFGNSAADGGALHILGGIVEIVNTTFSENEATINNGGAIYASTASAQVNIEASTIVYNKAATDGSALSFQGANGFIASSILFGNTTSAGPKPCYDMSGTLFSQGYNFDQDGQCGFTKTGDVAGSDAKLKRSLTDNGGYTRTHAFDFDTYNYSDLELVNAIPQVNCVSEDQRGQVRPGLSSSTNCEYGAYEVQDADDDEDELSGYGGSDLCDEFSGLSTPNEYYLDADNDRYYDQATVHAFCDTPASEYKLVSDVIASGDASDCNDADEKISPEKTEVPYDGVDNDCNAATLEDDVDSDGENSTITGGTDCVDNETRTTDDGVTVNPQDINTAATETWYDGVDQNCDGKSDYDQDGDADESAAETGTGGDCLDFGTVTTNTGAVIDGKDVNSAATETWYDNVDQDCSGTSDFDQDGDGEDLEGLDQNRNGIIDPIDKAAADCVDSDVKERTDGKLIPANLIFSTATEEWYDGVDQNCDEKSDYDQDGDTFLVTGYDTNMDRIVDSRDGDDCTDTNASIYVGATETWYDGVDQNCDGKSDYDQDGDGVDAAIDLPPVGTDCNDLDASVAIALYEDEDGDKLGNSAVAICSNLSSIAGYVDNSSDLFINDYDNDGSTADEDCDDTNEAVHPNQGEIIYNGLNDDCDDVTRDDDLDQDGFVRADDLDDTNSSVYTGAPEIADGIDNDGDGTVDENTDTKDDDGDGLSENQGDCNDSNAKIGKTTTFYFDGDRDSDGSTTAVALCVESMPQGFSTNNSDPDDMDPAINTRFNATNTGVLQSITAAGNGQVTLTYAGGTLLKTVFTGSQDKTIVQKVEDAGVVLVVSGDGKTVAVLDASTGAVVQTVGLPKNKVARGNNGVWVKNVKKGKKGKKQSTVIIISDNRVATFALNASTRTLSKKSSVAVKGVKITAPKVKKNRITVKTLDGKVVLMMTKKGKVKK